VLAAIAGTDWLWVGLAFVLGAVLVLVVDRMR
jgi:bacteriorhodopsin